MPKNENPSVYLPKTSHLSGMDRVLNPQLMHIMVSLMNFLHLSIDNGVSESFPGAIMHFVV